MDPNTEDRVQDRKHPNPPSVLPDSGGTYEFVPAIGKEPAALVATSPESEAVSDRTQSADVSANGTGGDEVASQAGASAPEDGAALAVFTDPARKKARKD